MTSSNQLAGSGSPPGKTSCFNVPAKDLIVIDTEGDLILKVIDGPDEEQDNGQHSQYVQKKDNGDTEVESVAFLALSEPTNSACIFVKVSKTKICATSDYFESMFGRDWAEAQYKFSKQNPPVITLEETDCKAAITVLRAMHHVVMFPPDEAISFEALKAVVHLAERWFALRCFHQSHIDGLGGRVLDTLPQSTKQERDFIFETKLVDILDMMEIIGDSASYQKVSWFMIEHLTPDSYWSLENSFITPTKTREILTTINRQILFNRNRALRAVLNLLVSLIDPECNLIPTGTLLARVIRLEVFRSSDAYFEGFNPVDGVFYLRSFTAPAEDPSPPERKHHCCKSLLPLLDLIHAGSLGSFRGSLKDLGETLVTYSRDHNKKSMRLCKACQHHTAFPIFEDDLKTSLSKIINDLNRIVRPLCITCFKQGLKVGRQFHFKCKDHDLNLRNDTARNWWQIAPMSWSQTPLWPNEDHYFQQEWMENVWPWKGVSNGQKHVFAVSERVRRHGVV